MQFNKKVLANGLTVIHEKRDVPVSTVMVATKFGASSEKIEEKGVAHFIEHLCFKGTKKRNTQEISSAIEKIGGSLNAFTHEDITVFHATVPSNSIIIAVDVLMDIYFSPLLLEEDINKERNVILEELKMYKDNPRYYTLNKIKEGMYSKPFGEFIAGTEESLRVLDKKKIEEIHKKYYCPANSILCVVGDNSFEEVLELANKFCVERNFVVDSPLKIEKKSVKQIEKRAGIEQANVAIGFHFPFFSSKERYAVEVFNAILGDGMSSRLFTEIREKRGLVYAIKTEIDLGKSYGYFVIYAGTDKDKVEEVIKISLEEFKKMENISAQELEEAKKQLIGSHRINSETSSAEALNFVLEEVHRKAENYLEYEKKVKEVRIEDIKVISNIVENSYFALIPQ